MPSAPEAAATPSVIAFRFLRNTAIELAGQHIQPVAKTETNPRLDAVGYRTTTEADLSHVHTVAIPDEPVAEARLRKRLSHYVEAGVIEIVK